MGIRLKPTRALRPAPIVGVWGVPLFCHHRGRGCDVDGADDVSRHAARRWQHLRGRGEQAEGCGGRGVFGRKAPEGRGSEDKESGAGARVGGVTGESAKDEEYGASKRVRG